MQIHEAMMRSTLKIIPNGENTEEVGSAFILIRPCTANPRAYKYILITANHVLDDFPGEEALLLYRSSLGDNWITKPIKIRIRRDGKKLWTNHPTADVAALYINELPTPPLAEGGLPAVPVAILADEALFRTIEMGPGDEIFTLGYPLNISSGKQGDFPFLRSGRIASFPLGPISSTGGVFYIDIKVFGGNSGGPVYLNQLGRFYGGSIYMDRVTFVVLGMVTQDVTYKEVSEGMDDTHVRRHSLGIARAVHAQFIRETIGRMPRSFGCF
ncbi:S1 family peptidase [Corallococcus llansteffanensis]|uniref:S1 family peptidase n=1 Tax=Corallococcus llansteffanensis TaxID=2316731 RepID=UPI0013156C02|nr:serine protease [Corallococcus llansteffanensis]